MTVVMISEGAGTKTDVDPAGLTEDEAPEFSPTEVGLALVTKLEADGTIKELDPVGLTSETGQIVVETGTTTVVKTVEAAGQFLTDSAQLMMVETWVEKMVLVVRTGAEVV
jgi:hypothetical protein